MHMRIIEYEGWIVARKYSLQMFTKGTGLSSLSG